MTQRILNRVMDTSGNEIQLTGVENGSIVAAHVMVEGSSIQVSTAPANLAEAYSAGDCIGSKLTFTNAMKRADGTGILQSLIIIDTDNIKPALTLLLFNSDPTAGTYTNNSAPSFSTDTTKIIRAISIDASDYQTIGGVAIADLSPGSRILTGVGTANIYGVLIATGTPTFTHANALTVKLGIVRD